MAIVDGTGRRDSRESAFELMVLNLKLAGPMFGGQSTLAPSLPTAIDFFASLP
jgi:hypothetical protein